MRIVHYKVYTTYMNSFTHTTATIATSGGRFIVIDTPQPSILSIFFLLLLPFMRPVCNCASIYPFFSDVIQCKHRPYVMFTENIIIIFLRRTQSIFAAFVLIAVWWLMFCGYVKCITFSFFFLWKKKMRRLCATLLRWYCTVHTFAIYFTLFCFEFICFSSSSSYLPH